MINILNYNREIKHYDHIVKYNLVVARIVVENFCPKEMFCNSL